MILAHLLALIATTAILAFFIKVGAFAVSAPNSSLPIVAIYTAYHFVVYLAAELFGLVKRPHYLLPLVSLSWGWIFICLISLIIANCWSPCVSSTSASFAPCV
jgi:hypothetical protein